jgi:hypothetical protein
VFLLESGGSLKGSSNLLSRTRIQDLDLRERERERSSRVTNTIKIYSPHSIITGDGLLHQTCPMGH